MISRSNVLLVVLCAFASLAMFIIVLFFLPTPESSLPIQTSTHVKETSTPDPVEFHDVSLAWRVVSNHRQTSKQLSSLAETLGGGICAIDVNKDGWMDLFFVGGSGHTRHYGKKSWWHNITGNRLLLNKQGHHFDDVTEQTGLQVPLWGMGCAVADFNNDGFPDLVVTGVGKNLIFKNNGNTSFSDVSAESGIFNDHWSTGASLADFNDDGLIDIYISNYILFEKGARTFERTSGFHITTNIAFDQTLYDPEPNRLYLNDGNFQFKEIGKSMGVEDSLGRSLGARWVDVNDDSWPDLLVVNDHSTPNQLFINEQGRSFTRGSELNTAFEITGAHDLAINNFNNDVKKSFFFSRGMGHPPVLLTTGNNNYLHDQIGTRPVSDDAYSDEAWSLGVAQTRLLAFSGWAAAAADFNNDGLLDLYVANGNTLPDIDSRFVSQPQPNTLFINSNDGNYVNQTPDNDSMHPYSSRGAISVDLDNDGKLEVVVSNNNDPLQIFKNQLPVNNWLGLDLQKSFTDAEIYGARLVVRTAVQTIHRTLQAPQSFLSQSDGRMHIGLGNANNVNELIISWRDGHQTLFKDIVPNQYYSVDKASNTLKAQHYQALSESHFEHSVSSYSEETLMHLTDLLISTNIAENNADDILMIWRQASTLVRKSILQQFSQQQVESSNSSSLTFRLILKLALEDSDAGIRLTAVQQLKLAELENSIVWLIPRLFDEDIDVRCAVTETFGFFFNEEEAVTHRKSLAIPPLLKLLESDSQQSVICAANALASAESKRALLPLLDLLQQNHARELEVQVKVAAIQALGLIRDTSAITLLAQQVTDPDSEAQVVASSLVALARLKAPELDALYSRFFTVSGEVSEQVHLFDTLFHLFSSTEGLVLSRPRLVTTLQTILDEQAIVNARQTRVALHDQVAVDLVALRVIGAAKSPVFEAIVHSYLEVKSQTVKVQALIALALINTTTSRQQFEIQLLDQSPIVIESVLGSLLDDNYTFSQQLVLSLFLQADTSVLALDLLNSLPSRRASTLLAFLIEKTSQTQDEMQLLSLLTLCTEAELYPFVEAVSGLPIDSSATRLQAVDCYLQTASDSLAAGSLTELQNQSTSSKRSLSTHGILKLVLEDPATDPDSRTRLLIKAAGHNPVIARTMLAKRMDSLPEEWLSPALAAIETAGELTTFHDNLWVLFKNQQRSQTVRLHAARLLAGLDDDAQTQVMTYLFDHFANENNSK